jgi:SAM-dependent methyltransferase
LSFSKPPNWYLDPLVAMQKREVHIEWISRSLPRGAAIGTILKTDLFEEAYGADELLFSLPVQARLKIGFDIDDATARSAAGRCQSTECVFFNADVRDLPLANDSIDLILSNSTLDHFETQVEIDESLRELVRVLKPGGTLLVSFDNPHNALFAVFRAALPLAGLSFRLGKTLSRSDLIRLLDRMGLEMQTTEWLIHNPRFLSTLLFLALRRIFGRQADPMIRGFLAAFAKFGKLPTRAMTGVFVAACARKPAGVSLPLQPIGAASQQETARR